MGADYIGWRNCPLQARLGPDGFLGKLKLRAYKRVVESRVPPEQRDDVQVEVQVTNRPTRTLRYLEIVNELAEFEAGIPECSSCHMSGGRPIGCYRYITYPVDEVFEDVLMNFMTVELLTADSIGDQLWRDVFSNVRDPGAWQTMRGPAGNLAARSEPITITWGGWFRQKKLSSAQVLAGLFITLDQLPIVVGFSRFFSELAAFAAANGVTGAHSQTLAELQDVNAMMTGCIVYALEGNGSVLVDS